MCVCVVFFFGLNQAHASNISYLAEAFIPICDQISKSREAKMYHSFLKFSTNMNVYTVSMNDNVKMIFDLVLNTICNVLIISIDNNSFNQFQKRKTQWKLDRGGGAIKYQDGGSGGHQTGRDKISSESCGHQRIGPSWCCSSSVSWERRRGQPFSTTWPGWRCPQVKKEWFCAPVVGWHLRRLGLHLWSPLHSSGTPVVYVCPGGLMSATSRPTSSSTLPSPSLMGLASC